PGPGRPPPRRRPLRRRPRGEPVRAVLREGHGLVTAATAFDIAGICAHPDDAELVMGGTVTLEARRGRRVALLDLTRGENGSRGTPEQRATEATEAARILGVAHRESLGLPDGALSPTTEQKDVLVRAL